MPELFLQADVAADESITEFHFITWISFIDWMSSVIEFNSEMKLRIQIDSIKAAVSNKQPIIHYSHSLIHLSFLLYLFPA